MAKILQFKNSDGSIPHHRQNDVPIVKFEDIFVQESRIIQMLWEECRLRNKLNDFIKSRIPTIHLSSSANYCSDLNEIAKLEDALGLQTVIITEYTPSKITEALIVYEDKHLSASIGFCKDEPTSRIINVITFISSMVKFKHKINQFT